MHLVALGIHGEGQEQFLPWAKQKKLGGLRGYWSGNTAEKQRMCCALSQLEAFPKVGFY